jgi:hypothetical protein
MAKKFADPLDFPAWIEFRKGFEPRGYMIRCIWHASDEIRIWAVFAKSEELPAPKHPTFITRHYPDGNGFGVWLESCTGKIDEGVDEIIGTIK